MIALAWFKEVSGQKASCYLNRVKLLIISEDRDCISEGDSNLGPRRFAVSEDCKATALTTQPQHLDAQICYFMSFSGGGGEGEIIK